jgi:hypothetical protein
MYYNNNDKILIRKIPKNILRDDGSLFINFDHSDVDTLSDYGFYSLRNDNNARPTPDSIEDESKRQILLDKPYFDIIREWIDIPTTNIKPNTKPKITEESDDVL